MDKLKKFFRLKQKYRLLLVEAFLSLWLSWFILTTTEFKKIAPRLGRHMREVSCEVSDIQVSKATRVGWAVNVMSKYTLWESKCLVKAMAAKFMLDRRKLKNTLYLGMGKDENGNLVAHAWIKSCGITLTGGANAGEFTVVSVFGE